MKRYKRAVIVLLAATLTLLPLALTSCSHPAAVIVMPEAKAIPMEPGDKAPEKGWLLSESALLKLLEKAESCK